MMKSPPDNHDPSKRLAPSEIEPYLEPWPDSSGFKPARDGKLRGNEKRNRVIIVAAFAVAMLAIIAAGVVVVTSRNGETATITTQKPTTTVEIVVSPGMTATQVAALLQEKGVIKSSSEFLRRVEADGAINTLQPGTYKFSTNQDIGTVANSLEKGLGQPGLKAVIPEGFATSQVVPVLSKLGMTNSASYVQLAAEPSKFSIPKVGDTTPSITTLEGLLFPSTYFLQPGDGPSQLIKAQLATFTSKTATLDWAKATTLKVTPYQVVIVASIIEKEAKVPADRAKVATVVYNRLAKGMTLGLDSTVRFATGKWTGPLTGKDLQIDSPYNTRIKKGLPPGPICNPGIAALKAALQPAKADYLYFVSDSQGNLFFTGSYKEFLNVKSGPTTT